MTEIKAGFTDRTELVFIPDPAQTDGTGKTGLVAASLTVSYSRVETDNDVTVTDVTSSLNNLSALTDAHNDWGLKEVSSTLAPGLYRLDIADAVFASGAWSAVVYVTITTSLAAASPMKFELVAFDPLDAAGFGLSRLDAAVTTRASQTSVDTIDDFLDTEIAAIVTATGAAAIRTAIGLASANLDTQLDALPTNAELATALGTADDAVLAQVALVKAKTDLIPGTIDGKTFAQIVTLVSAVLLGKASGLGTTTAVYRDMADAKDRVTSTVDASGNRSAVTLDAT